LKKQFNSAYENSIHHHSVSNDSGVIPWFKFTLSQLNQPNLILFKNNVCSGETCSARLVIPKKATSHLWKERAQEIPWHFKSQGS